MPRRVRFVLVFALLAAACSAQHEEDDAPNVRVSRSEIDAHTFCATLCGRETACSGTSEGPHRCASTCTRTNEAALSRIRADVLVPVRVCVAAAECRLVNARLAVDGCFRDVALALEDSPASRHLCTMFDDAYALCETSLDHEKCVADAKKYDDAALAEAQGCAQKPCAEISACIRAALPPPFAP
jgi:hypothetical protein